ncbi:MAG: hypothetical protein GY787_10755 [Alteromonadales bacterium]|nr:hypothetical protein [Alteromonadales bacterium]
MNQSEFLNILISGNERDLSDLSFSLLNISEMSTLENLCIYVEEIQSVLHTVGASETGKINSLKRMLSFLKPISNGGCRCEKYNICFYMPYSEQNKGLVKVISAISNKETFETQCICICTVCHKIFEVKEYEAGFGRRADWKVKIQVA